MFRLLILSVFLFITTGAFAASDSLFVVHRGDGWMIAHEIKAGESMFSLARHYHMPPALLSDANKLPYAAPLLEHSTYYIPIIANNRLTSKPANMGDARELYYRVTADIELRAISKYSGVSINTIQGWNNISGGKARYGQVLFVGWVLYDATEPLHQTLVTNNKPAATTIQPLQQPQQVHHISVQDDAMPVQKSYVHEEIITIPTPDTVKQVSKEEEIFLSETNNGTNPITEKGPAAFFESAHHGDLYYAFHNGTPKDKIIKVFNPGNGRTIFVHTIGVMPEIKLYTNCIIGISANAKEALGVNTDKGWVELSFGN